MRYIDIEQLQILPSDILLKHNVGKNIREFLIETPCIMRYVSKYKRAFTVLIHSFQGFSTIMKVIFPANPSSDL